MTSDGPEKKFNIRHLPYLVKDAVISWNKDDPWRFSAVIAYYAILSFPGLLVIVITILSCIWCAEPSRHPHKTEKCLDQGNHYFVKTFEAQAG